jgi:hypothetical protein
VIKVSYQIKESFLKTKKEILWIPRSTVGNIRSAEQKKSVLLIQYTDDFVSISRVHYAVVRCRVITRKRLIGAEPNAISTRIY